MPKQDQPKHKPTQLNKADFQILRQAAEVERRIEELEVAQPSQAKVENVVGAIKPAQGARQLKLISDAEKADIEVNQILVHRLVRAILSDEEKAA